MSLVEITLWFAGLSLIGSAAGATFARWSYQTQQERALFEGGPAVAVRAQPREVTVAAPARGAPASSPTRAAEDSGPPRVRRRAPAADPAAIGRIEIPRLGIAAIVREGDDERTLARAVGLVPGSAHPGEAGNIVLAGHRDTFFRPLRKIDLYDRIRLIVPPHTYEYQVKSLRVVKPEETSILESNGQEQLTLVTCYPFRFVGPSPERFVVRAIRVE